MQGIKCSRNFVAEKTTLAIIIVMQVGFFVYALNNVYLVTFRKILDHPESCIRYTFTINKFFTRDFFSKETRIPIRYACNNFYALFLDRKFAMDE